MRKKERTSFLYLECKCHHCGANIQLTYNSVTDELMDAECPECRNILFLKDSSEYERLRHACDTFISAANFIQPFKITTIHLK